MTSQLHVQELLQALKAVKGEAEDETGELPGRGNVHEAATDETESIQLGALAVCVGGRGGDDDAIRWDRCILVEADRRGVAGGMLAAQKQKRENITNQFVGEVVELPWSVHCHPSMR